MQGCNTFFCVTDSVENLMVDTHELGGSTVVVDRATPKVCDVAASVSFSLFFLMELFYSLIGIFLETENVSFSSSIFS